MKASIQTMRLTGATLLACVVMAGQTSSVEGPVYRVSVTARTAKAINYQHRSGATKIDFRGTSLLPAAHGEAKVESKQGYIEIEVEFRELKPANALGAEYLTYVLWAITPEGRTSNLGEILLNGTNSKLNVTTELQVFGLVVTAEPYYAVGQPSDLIVMENAVRPDTRGKIEEIDAKYELLQKGQYARLANPLSLKLDPKVPLELYEARNAVQIATSMGAERFANDALVKAQKSLAQAEAYQARKAGTKPVTMTSREAVQTAEDARAIAVKRQEADALALDKQQAADREIRALAEADRANRDKEAQTVSASNEADRVKQGNDLKLATLALEADRLKLESDARLAASQLESDRVRSDAAAKLAASQAETDRLKGENAEVTAASALATANAAQQKHQMETDQAALRVLLMQQLNVILQTQDTARGLIVNMPDVLFDTGKFQLRPEARLKLARLAGIIAGHPGLSLAVEGHTDSVGTTADNQLLSENRSVSVRNFLSQQGMASGILSGRGFGEEQPIASNLNAAGRQQNRRVEIVVSGDLIGSK